MGYYIRVLSTSLSCVPLSALQASLVNHGVQAVLAVKTSNAEGWEQLVLSHVTGAEIALIERNLVGNGTLGSEELAEFAEEIAHALPASAVNWLLGYFSRVKCIYAFQLLEGINSGNGWDALGAVKDCFWSYSPSIIQADGEGFSNEDGYHILWQFHPSVKGDWWMGVLQEGHWKHFKMDLGNPVHREAFLKGNIPSDVEMAT